MFRGPHSLAGSVSALVAVLVGCAIDDRGVDVVADMGSLQPATTGAGNGSTPADASGAGGAIGRVSAVDPPSMPSPAAVSGGSSGTNQLLPPSPATRPAPDAMGDSIGTGASDGLSLDVLDPSNAGIAFQGSTCSVSQGGDLNGDGRADFLASSEGAAYALFGPDQLAPVDLEQIPERVPGIVLDLPGDTCGTISVAAGGDVNGDGFDDFIVASSYRRYAGVAEGAVFVVFGAAQPRRVEATALEAAAGDGFVIRGPGTNGLRGSAMRAGDLDGDGLDDILITGSAGAHVVFGKRDFASVALSSIIGGKGVSGFMYSQLGIPSGHHGGIANLGDLNGDGLDDLALGDKQTGAAGGRVFVTWGSTIAPGTELVQVTSGFVIDGAQMGDGVGETVGAAGDVNGDGVPDILVGGSRGLRSLRAPLAYLVFGKSDTAPVELAAIEAGQGGGFAIGRRDGDFNITLSSAGDVNGDGLDDLLIDSFDAGRTYLLFGRRETSPISLANLDPSSADGLTLLTPGGITAAGVGDVNGDGLEDVLLGAAAGMRIVYGPGTAL